MGVLLVTGGGGFVLSHLARQWAALDAGNRVIVLDAAALDEPARAFLAPAGERLAFMRGSVADPAAWEALAGHPWRDGVTYVVHGAAVTSIDRLRRAGGLGAVVPALETNITGTARALAFAEALPGLRRFICVSSGSVYADHGRQAPGQPLPEDGNVAPSGFYAVTKLAGEMLTARAAGDCGLPALSVRLSGVYGPMDRETPARAVDCAPKRMLHLHRAGRVVRISGAGAVGDYIHAGDVAAALIALLTCARPRHPVYNVALGEVVSLRELARLISGIVPGFRFEETPPDSADIRGDPGRKNGRWGAYDISRLIADTGWRPRLLADALADYAAWLSANPC
jgi:nucleoside-diphosphate-sugar epimerase